MSHSAPAYDGIRKPSTVNRGSVSGRRASLADVQQLAKSKKAIDNKNVTGASELTLRQSIFPCVLVTILFFLWGFAYGLLDVL